MIEIQLNLNKPVNYGQAIFVCGNLTNIGSWIPEKSLRLNWSSVHLYRFKRVITGLEHSKYKKKNCKPIGLSNINIL